MATKTPPLQYRTHGSYLEMVQASMGPSEMIEKHRSSRNKSDSTTWDLGKNWNDAIKLAQSGDMDTARKLSPAILKEANSHFQNSPRHDPVFRVEGGRWIDVARYIKGEPECWGDFEEQEIAPKPGVAIAVHAGVNGGLGAEGINRASIELCSHVLGLQAMGYPVTVYWVDNTRGYTVDNYQPQLVLSFPMNPNGRPLDVAQLAVAFTPWFYRRVVFSWFETQLNVEDRNSFGIRESGGYGGVEEITSVHLAKICDGYDRKIFIRLAEAAKKPGYIAKQIQEQVELATA